jgi:hypothetical protein
MRRRKRNSYIVQSPITGTTIRQRIFWPVGKKILLVRFFFRNVDKEDHALSDDLRSFGHDVWIRGFQKEAETDRRNLFVVEYNVVVRGNLNFGKYREKNEALVPSLPPHPRGFQKKCDFEKIIYGSRTKKVTSPPSHFPVFIPSPKRSSKTRSKGSLCDDENLNSRLALAPCS